MTKGKKRNTENQLIANAFLNIIKDTPRTSSESIVEELDKVKRRR
jgi:hypothetical protein